MPDLHLKGVGLTAPTSLYVSEAYTHPERISKACRMFAGVSTRDVSTVCSLWSPVAGWEAYIFSYWPARTDPRITGLKILQSS